MYLFNLHGLSVSLEVYYACTRCSNVVRRVARDAAVDCEVDGLAFPPWPPHLAAIEYIHYHVTTYIPPPAVRVLFQSIFALYTMVPSDAGSTTANKRRRLNDHLHHDLQFSDLFSAGLLPTPSTPADSSFQFATQPLDGTGGTPLGSIDFSNWSLDEFSHDPVYLASQEELRGLLFSTAQSAAPTRAGSPAGGAEDESSMPHQMREILSSSKRVEYLKNYIGQVAPWVRYPA